MASGSRRYRRALVGAASAADSGDLDRERASFDKLRMRSFVSATKKTPHPELVEGRWNDMPPYSTPPAPGYGGRGRGGDRRADAVDGGDGDYDGRVHGDH